MQAQVMLPALLYYCLCENCHANTTTTQRSWLYRQIFHNNTITHTSYHLGLFHNLHQKVWKVFHSKTFMFLNTKFPIFFFFTSAWSHIYWLVSMYEKFIFSTFRRFHMLRLKGRAVTSFPCNFTFHTRDVSWKIFQHWNSECFSLFIFFI